MKSERSRLVKKVDTAFSKYIRARDYIKFGGLCPFHGRNDPHPIEVCFHFLSRVSHATRWREDNAIGSCAGCNFLNEAEPTPFILYFIDNYGREKLDYLQGLYHTVAKYTRSDLELLEREYIEKFKALASS